MDNILTLQIASPSLKEQLMHVLSLMKGVRIVSTDASTKNVALDEDIPNATTLAAMKEVERVVMTLELLGLIAWRVSWLPCRKRQPFDMVRQG